jgi:Uma2 family endonuclease
MTAAKQIQLLSVEDYLERERLSRVKHEYAGGYVYAMAGARNVHNKIAVSFTTAMGIRLRGKACQPFNSDTKVRVRMPTHVRFYYPDGMVVCDPNPDEDSFQDRPVIIAEVISDATRRTDEGEKRDAYLSIPTLSAYLVIESSRPRVVVHHRAPDGFTARVYEGVDAVIPLDVLHTELPLAELYERTRFLRARADDDCGERNQG